MSSALNLEFKWKMTMDSTHDSYLCTKYYNKSFITWLVEILLNDWRQSLTTAAEKTHSMPECAMWRNIKTIYFLSNNADRQFLRLVLSHWFWNGAYGADVMPCGFDVDKSSKEVHRSVISMPTWQSSGGRGNNCIYLMHKLFINTVILILSVVIHSPAFTNFI